jgi:hypothetical protein
VAQLGLLSAAAFWQGVLLFRLHAMNHTTADKRFNEILCEGGAMKVQLETEHGGVTFVHGATTAVATQ